MANILIFGAGAVGQFIGGLLTRFTQNKVTMIGRADHYNAVKESALNIKRPQGQTAVRNVVYHPMIERIPATEVFDWVFMTVKAYDLKNSFRELKYIVQKSKDVKFLFFQRGVGSEQILKGIIPEERVYLAALTANVACVEPGTIIQTSKEGTLCIAPMKLRNDTEELRKLFLGSQIDVKTYEDWRPMKWSALLSEIMLNAFCAISDFSPQKLVARKRLLKLEMESLAEAVKLVKKMGLEILELPGYPLKKFIMLNMIPSFMRAPFIQSEYKQIDNQRVPTIKNDMEKAKKATEVSYLNGAVQRWGRERGVNTPVNGFVTDELNKVVQGKVAWEVYRHKPEEIEGCYNIYKLNYDYV